jgi:hypothetical protein
MAFDLSNYETVEDRLIRFWADHPNGRIATSLIAQDGDQVIFRAEVFFEYLDTLPKATGYAEESVAHRQSIRPPTSRIVKHRASAAHWLMPATRHTANGRHAKRCPKCRAQAAKQRLGQLCYT